MCLWKYNVSVENPAAIQQLGQVAKTEAEHIRLSKTTATSSHFSDRPSMSQLMLAMMDERHLKLSIISF